MQTDKLKSIAKKFNLATEMTLGDCLHVTARKKSEYVKKLKEAFGATDTWFISGSFASGQITTPNDIDVYFYTVEGYNAVVDHLKTQTNVNKLIGKSKFATTYILPNIALPVQLITTSFGSPQEVFESMDLNVCKQALLPDLTVIADKTAFDPLTITTAVSTDTFDRYIKYYLRARPKHKLDNAFIYLFDNYIENNTCVTSYYKETNLTPINKLLFDLYKDYTDFAWAAPSEKYVSQRVQNQLTELVQRTTPELLL